MARHSFIQMSKLSNVKGRISYISDPKRQEYLYTTFSTREDMTFWNDLAKECQAKGQTATAVMNAANEVAVGAFLNREIGFLDIARVVEKVVETSDLPPVATIRDVVAVDAAAREAAARCLKG